MSTETTEETVEHFNALYPVGTPVRYWPHTRTGEGRESVTRTPAWLVSGHPCVSVTGYPGGIALTHVVPVHLWACGCLINDAGAHRVGCPEPADSCPACGSESRAECYYVPGRTGMPVTCGSDWHDEDARAPGDHLVAPESGHDGKCIYCEHGPYCTQCPPPGSIPDDAHAAGLGDGA